LRDSGGLPTAPQLLIVDARRMRQPRDIERARSLRASGTDAERRLWKHLRGRRLGGFKFRRQHPLDGYFVDFYCAEIGLIVELDGGQHVEREGRDTARTRSLERCGRQVIRFWNDDVLVRTDIVLQVIFETASRLRLP
jgi:very-short-patch-repair endonuclease